MRAAGELASLDSVNRACSLRKPNTQTTRAKTKTELKTQGSSV